MNTSTALRETPSDEGAVVQGLTTGEQFDLLDDSLGWGWGYAGEKRQVGYVRSDTLAAQ
jgi:hypothetical protein